MIKNLFVFTLILGSLSTGIGWVVNLFAQPSFQVWIVGFLAVATWLVFFLVSRVTSPDSFLKSYLLSIVLKLLAGGIFISIIIYLDKPAANSNAILFMIDYLVLTALEVGYLFNLRNKA